MRLLNFQLERPVRTITIRGLGHDWDLHNCAGFAGFQLDGANGTLLLRWIAILEPKWGCTTTPWGDATNTARSCGLLFRRVHYLRVLATHEPGSSQPGGTGLSGLSKTAPGKGELGFRKHWSDDEESHLYFEFYEGQTLEVGAESVELVADPE
jgi:hypothetical protein